MSEVNNTVNTLIEEIKGGLKQKNASQKDEVRVMQAMLNDTEYEVGLYNKSGEYATYNPAQDYKSMIGSVISATTKISKEEAQTLANEHEVSKQEATSMVNISKQFTLTYLETGRKYPFGGRKDTNFALSLKDVPERVKPCPQKVGIDDGGNDIYEIKDKTTPAHLGLKAYGSCPEWLK